MSSQVIYRGECMHVKLSEQSQQNRNQRAKQYKTINQQQSNMSMSQTNISMKHIKSWYWKSQSRQISQHNQHVKVPNGYNI